MTRSLDTVVIGAGHNGLVAAAYLARAGQQVRVLERRDVIGGAAATEELFPGFRVDSGSHRIGGLSPQVVDDLKLETHGLRVLYPEAAVFTPVLEGLPLTLWKDPARTQEGLRPLSAADATAWPGFVKLLADAAEFVAAAGALTPPDVTGRNLGDLWSSGRLGLRLRRLGKRQMVEVMRILPMSVYELLDEWFESDVVRGTIAASGITGLNQGPMAAGTVYTLLHQQAGTTPAVRGTRRVAGGVGGLNEALLAACRAHGVEVRTSAPVAHILVKDGAAHGVVLEDGEEIRARRIVSGADPRTTFLDLVDPLALDPEFVRSVRNIRFQGICAKVHLALGGLPDFVGQPGPAQLEGVVSISPSLEYLERAYDDAKYGSCSNHPYLEVSIPSLTDASVAPEGKHLASILMQYAPFGLREGTWDGAARDALGESVVQTLARYAPGIDALIEDRHVLTPLDLETRFGLPEGNIYHGEMTLDQLLFMRPVPGASRYRAPIAGLYLCGSGAHPGGGVTGMPGFNAAREILKDRDTRTAPR